MKKVRLGRTDLEVTRWSLGGIAFSTIMSGNTEESMDDVLNAALDYGINFIDTSRMYMDSETNIGRVMKTRRAECILASKSLSRTRDEVLGDIAESLKELQTDKIDLLQMHAVRAHEVSTVLGKGGALEALQKARDDGMIDFIGVTSHHIDVLIDMMKTDAFDTVMFPFNVIEREPEKELLPLAKSRDIGTIVMKPIAGGAIRNIAKAFRFFYAYPVDTILNGVANITELRQNLKCAEEFTSLSVQELKDFEKEVAPLGKEFCRRCNYCAPCSSDIMIPDMIHLYAQAVKGKKFEDLPVEKQEVGRNLLIWLQACID
jgi:predicted aldo/keto reductase-like oxidoreductase